MFLFFCVYTILRYEFNTFYLKNVLLEGETAKKGCQSPNTLRLELLSATRSACGNTARTSVWSTTRTSVWNAYWSTTWLTREVWVMPLVRLLAWTRLWRVVVTLVSLVGLVVLVAVACTYGRRRRRTTWIKVTCGATCGRHIYIYYHLLWFAIEWSVCVISHYRAK